MAHLGLNVVHVVNVLHPPQVSSHPTGGDSTLCLVVWCWQKAQMVNSKKGQKWWPSYKFS